MRRRLIAGNWKMFKTGSEGAALAKTIREGVAGTSVDLLVAPPFTSIAAVVEVLRGSTVAVAGQNMHWEKEGAFTGEVSAPMLRDAGCSHVLLGHSERRQLFGETDETVAQKGRAAIENGLTPILCVGETLAEREAGRTQAVVESQVQRALRDLTSAEVGQLVLAYEPVWAIGTGRTATSEQAQEVHGFIRGLVLASHGNAAAATVRILYGGSVKPANAGELLAAADIDGALVGGASLTADSFLGIARA